MRVKTIDLRLTIDHVSVMNFLTAYAHYLFRRETAILMTFRRRGRTRRLFIPAYWQSTLLPLTVPVGFVFTLLFGSSQTLALICGLAMFLGVVVGELMLFQQNKMAWPVFERVLRWDHLAAFHEKAIGSLPAMNPATTKSENRINVPVQLRRMILKGYVTARRNPPSFEAWFGRAPELRSIAFLIILVVTFSFVDFLADPSGVWLVGPAFFIGIQLRRAKMAIDFILTWPLMEKFIDWQAVYRDAGTVEEVEF